MKLTLTTIFAFALMVFAFNAGPVMATGQENEKEQFKQGFKEVGEVMKCGFQGKSIAKCKAEGRIGQAISSLYTPEEQERLAGFVDYCKKHGNCMMKNGEPKPDKELEKIYYSYISEIDDLRDLDQTDSEKDVADSSDGSTTSAAGATEQ
ncbi:MAG: hypothetical protein OXF05_00355 [Hyphomicrobiales bacterium]|nr:hypothetical protein [Hyphomicrobiales bacterium]MCY4032642.1 hypothetical protein [Hyphomicrobiales bacterium]MCY4039582.1 hypothetical protein [Hyphomicrobiales bacterium]